MEYEIIVVDNNSSDATITIIEKSFPAVRIIKNQQNKGFAVAANQGANLAVGEILFFLNPDTEIPNEFAGHVIQLMKDFPNRRIIGFQFVDSSGNRSSSSWKLPTIRIIAVESWLPFRLSDPIVSVTVPSMASVEMVSGGCMMIRSEEFRSLQGFDERFFLYYEDADLCLRARHAGYAVVLNPDVQIIHRGRGSFDTSYYDFYPLYYRGKLLYCSKHFTPTGFRIARFCIMSGILLRIVLYNLARLFPGMSDLAKGHLNAYRQLQSFDIR